MKILFVGAGAIGSLLGAYMAKGGADVILLGRGDHIQRISKSGLKVNRIGGDCFTVNVRAVSDSKLIQDVDILILAVKSQQTELALASVGHLKDKVSLALSVQNGVEKEEQLIRFFGKENVCGAICFEGATRLGPGEIRHTMSNISYLGELDGKFTERIRAVCQLFRDGGLKAEVSANIISAEWAKWAAFSAAAAICSITRLEYWKILTNKYLALLAAQIYREYSQLAAAKGINVIDFPGFEFKTVSQAHPLKAVELLNAVGYRMEAKGMKSSKPSLLQDLEGGKKTEYQAIFGYALREAEKQGLKMPLTQTVYHVLKGIDEYLGF